MYVYVCIWGPFWSVLFFFFFVKIWFLVEKCEMGTKINERPEIWGEMSDEMCREGNVGVSGGL